MPVFRIYQTTEDRETMNQLADVLEAKGVDLTDTRRGVRSLSKMVRIVLKERLEQEQTRNDR